MFTFVSFGGNAIASELHCAIKWGLLLTVGSLVVAFLCDDSHSTFHAWGKHFHLIVKSFMLVHELVETTIKPMLQDFAGYGFQGEVLSIEAFFFFLPSLNC